MVIPAKRWLKSACGLDPALREVPRETAFCAYAVLSEGETLGHGPRRGCGDASPPSIIVVEDASNQARCHFGGRGRKKVFLLFDGNIFGSKVFKHCNALLF